MDSTDERSTVTREEAAALLGVSVRTIDRHIPAGTPGRTSYRRTPGKVRIDRALVERLMPAPGGDPVVRDE